VAKPLAFICNIIKKILLSMTGIKREHLQRTKHSFCKSISSINYIHFVYSLSHHKLFVLLTSVLSALSYYFYLTPGPHQAHIQSIEKQVLWSLYWLWLGVLSSIGFGSGLHTFLLYLGPHIARVTLAAYSCKSLDFPNYPDE
jgi:hypothetical protein